jgi:hypothetical protein
MKYFKHVITMGGETSVRHFRPEGTNSCIPLDPDNMDYARMMAEVESGSSTIEEVDDTP